MRSQTRLPWRSKAIHGCLVWLAILAPALAFCASETAEAPIRPSREGQAASSGRSYTPYPEPDIGYVTDCAGLLTAKQKDDLNAYCYTTEKNTGVEVVVVTIRSIQDYPGTANGSIESFATGLFDTYGIGNLPKNDGVLLLVAQADRKVRIELGKYYGRSRDSDADKIIQKVILPRFRKDDYAGGIEQGTEAIIREFAGLRFGVPWRSIVIVATILALVPIFISLYRSGKRGWGWVVVGILIILIVLLFKTTGKVVERLPRGSGAGGFGGGFGGGSSGGGGATGSW